MRMMFARKLTVLFVALCFVLTGLNALCGTCEGYGFAEVSFGESSCCQENPAFQWEAGAGEGCACCAESDCPVTLHESVSLMRSVRDISGKLVAPPPRTAELPLHTAPTPPTCGYEKAPASTAAIYVRHSSFLC